MSRTKAQAFGMAYLAINKKLSGPASYDFVYGHGSIGAVASLITRRRKIPTGLRVYGIGNVEQEMRSRPNWFFALKYPLRYLSFRTPKAFLIATNDGSRADQIWKKCHHDSYDFHFLINGLDFWCAGVARPGSRFQDADAFLSGQNLS